MSKQKSIRRECVKNLMNHAHDSNALASFYGITSRLIDQKLHKICRPTLPEDEPTQARAVCINLIDAYNGNLDFVGPDHADTTFVSNHVPYIKNKKKRDSRRKEHHRKYEDFLHDVIKRCNNIGATPGASFQKGVECFLCCIDVCVCKKGSV